jgi:hypothetical protein
VPAARTALVCALALSAAPAAAQDGAGETTGETTATASTTPSMSTSTMGSADADADADAEAEAEADADAEADAEADADADDGGLVFYGRVGGEYQLRGNAMSDIPLTPLPRRPDTAELGQNYWAEQWLRLRGEIGFRDVVRLVGELDLLFGVAFGDLAIGTTPAAWPRDDYGYPGLRLRHLYIDWNSPIGIVRVGQMGFSWGLGILANDGETPPPFGDYRYGDLVRRVLFATRPFGTSSPFVVALAGDWIAWDLVADWERPCRRAGQSNCGDTAFQGVLAAYYEEGDDRLGGFLAYRSQQSHLGDFLEVFVLDLYGRWHVPDPTGGRFFLAAEAAVVTGATSLTRTVDRPRADVTQLLAAVQLGRTHADLDLVLEGGYASGDSNTEDGSERRATFDPDHRVGLVLFPEVLASQSARSAHLAQTDELSGRPARGSELLPTNGGVSGAFYLFAYGIWRPLPWLEARLGSIVAWASADVVDPYRQRAESRSVNYRGGDPTRRDLGLEVDAAILFHADLGGGVHFSGGLEGGLLFPGHAFDDASGNTMGEVGLARARGGLRY